MKSKGRSGLTIGIFNWLQNYFKSFSKGLNIPISVEQKTTNDNNRETRYEQHN